MTRLQFVGPHDGWAVAGSELLVTRDGGRRWRVLSRVDGLRAIDFVSQRRGWAVTDKGNVVATKDGRRFFTQRLPGAVRTIDFLDARTGWALTRNGELLHSGNGGRTGTGLWRVPSGTNWPDGGAQMVFPQSRTG